MKHALWLFVLLLSSASFTHAQSLISDGSFEENCFSPVCAISTSGTVAITIGDDWNYFQNNNGNNIGSFQIVLDNNASPIATDGNYYSQLLQDSSVNGSTVSLRNLQVLNGGRLFFDANFLLIGSSNGVLKIQYAYENINLGVIDLFSTNNPSSIQGNDANFILSNLPGYIQFSLFKNATVTSDSIFRFDNVRWEKYPLIDLTLPPFAVHISSGQEFSIKGTYSPSASCFITNETNSQNYPMTENTAGNYATSFISFDTGSSNSVFKQFSMTCNGLKNSDSRYRLKISAHPSISSNGGFDINGQASASVTSSTAIRDWNWMNTNGGFPGSASIIENTAAKISSDGQHYIRLTGPASGGPSSFLTSTTDIIGGTAFFDINSYFGGGSDLNFVVRYDFSSGGSQTLFSMNDNDVGNGGSDFNVTLPNQLGHLSFVMQGSSSPGVSQLLLDNVRYTNPKFSESTSCKQVIYNGDPDKKIDLVFTGSGFPDTSKLKEAAEFATDYSGIGNGIMSFEPFKSNKEKFNIWYVDLNKTYKTYKGKAHWKFDYRALEDATNACPWGNEYVLLSITPRVWPNALTEVNYVTPTDKGAHWAFITLGCEFTGTCSLPLDINRFDPQDPFCQGDGNVYTCGLDNIAATTTSELQRLVAHEFGHSFGGLLDEYVNAPNLPFPSGSAPNCSSSNTCPLWSSISGTICDPGCTRPNWYKAFDESNSTLMWSHADPRREFKIVNENELKKDILNYDTATSPPNAFLTYLAHLTFANGVFSLSNLQMATGTSPETLVSTDSSYKAKIIGSDGSDLFDYNFSLPTESIYEGSLGWFDINGIQTVIPDYNLIESISDTNFTLPIPYIANAIVVKIFDNNGALLGTIPLAKISVDLSYSSGNIVNSNYSVCYVLGDQLVAQLASQSYKVEIGLGID